tara:strand:+ start:1564 stop:1686 length:123 start_codon:yes stop_codon:yes gene_type:complete
MEKCVNIVRVGDKVFVTVRYYDENGYFDRIIEGDMKEVMV